MFRCGGNSAAAQVQVRAQEGAKGIAHSPLSGRSYPGTGNDSIRYLELAVFDNDKSVKNTARKDDEVAFNDLSHSLKKRRAVGIKVEDRALACAED